MFPIVHFKIKDKSMEPTFKEGDYILVNRLAYLFSKPSKGDVIVLENPKEKNKFLVKRISTIGSGKYFVAGDNEKYSQDSRHFGLINKSLIVGKLLFHIKQ